jgi:hypothetical protein
MGVSGLSGSNYPASFISSSAKNYLITAYRAPDSVWSTQLSTYIQNGGQTFYVNFGASQTDNPTTYANSAVAFLKANPQIKYVGSINEPNLNKWTPAQYAPFLIALYNAIKNAGLPQLVCGFEVSGYGQGSSTDATSPYGFIYQCINNQGCAGKFDRCSIHFYPPNGVQTGLGTNLDNIHSLVNTPLMIMETNICGGGGAYGGTNPIGDMTNLLTMIYNKGYVEMVAWYDWADNLSTWPYPLFIAGTFAANGQFPSNYKSLIQQLSGSNPCQPPSGGCPSGYTWNQALCECVPNNQGNNPLSPDGAATNSNQGSGGGGGGTLALDGSAENDSGQSTVTSVTASITTTNSPDLIIAVVANRSGETPTVSGGGISWATRGHSSDGVLWEFYGTANSAGTFNITASVSSATQIRLVLFGISGANTSNPFDPNLSSPVTANGSSTTPSTNITTTNANDFIIGLLSCNGSPTVTLGSGYTKIKSGSNTPLLEAEYQIVSVTESSFAVNYSVSPSQTWDLIADAIQQASGTGGTANSCSVVLNTTKSNDLIVVFGGYTAGSTTQAGISDSVGLTWQIRSGFPYYDSSNQNTLYEWYAIAPNPLTNCTIEVSLTGAVANITVCAQAIASVNTSQPFDPGSGIPKLATGNSASPSATITTTNAEDMIIGGLFAAGSPTITPATNFTEFINPPSGGGGGSLAIDGTAQTNRSSNVTSTSITYSTTKSPDIVVAFVTVAGYNGTVTMNDSAGVLKWTLSEGPITNTSNNQSLYYFQAVASQALSSDKITATVSATTSIDLLVFAISGADTSALDDPNNSLPIGATSFGTNPNAGISTSNANDMIIAGFAGNGGPTMTPGSGFTAVTTTPSNTPITWAQYEIVSALQSQILVQATASTAQYWCWIVDAIMASSTTVNPVVNAEYWIVNSTQASLAVGYTLSTGGVWMMVADAIQAQGTGGANPINGNGFISSVLSFLPQGVTPPPATLSPSLALSAPSKTVGNYDLYIAGKKWSLYSSIQTDDTLDLNVNQATIIFPDFKTMFQSNAINADIQIYRDGAICWRGIGVQYQSVLNQQNQRDWQLTCKNNKIYLAREMFRKNGSLAYAYGGTVTAPAPFQTQNTQILSIMNDILACQYTPILSLGKFDIVSNYPHVTMLLARTTAIFALQSLINASLWEARINPDNTVDFQQIVGSQKPVYTFIEGDSIIDFKFVYGIDQFVNDPVVAGKGSARGTFRNVQDQQVFAEPTNNSSSLAQFGRWSKSYNFSSVADINTLEAYANALQNDLQKPIYTLDLTVRVGVSGVPFRVGDVVTVTSPSLQIYNQSYRVIRIQRQFDSQNHEQLTISVQPNARLVSLTHARLKALTGILNSQTMNSQLFSNSVDQQPSQITNSVTVDSIFLANQATYAQIGTGIFDLNTETLDQHITPGTNGNANSYQISIRATITNPSGGNVQWINSVFVIDNTTSETLFQKNYPMPTGKVGNYDTGVLTFTPATDIAGHDIIFRVITEESGLNSSWVATLYGWINAPSSNLLTSHASIAVTGI